MNDPVRLFPEVVVEGRRWHLFSVEFKADDRTYSTYIYALSAEHAEYALTDLKETGRVTGPILGAVPA